MLNSRTRKFDPFNALQKSGVSKSSDIVFGNFGMLTNFRVRRNSVGFGNAAAMAVPMLLVLAAIISLDVFYVTLNL